MKTLHFRDLQIWQRSMKLAEDIYLVTNNLPRAELFGLTSQLRRAAVSVPGNIAEGHGRTTDKAFALFLGQARGSLYELETQLQLAHNLGYVDQAAFQHLATEGNEIGRMINGLLGKLKASDQA